MAEDGTAANRISEMLPGFHGYARVDSRLADDKLLRQQVANGLVAQRDRLAEVGVDLLARRDRRFAEVDMAVMSLQSLIDAIKGFDPSGSPWGSRARLREEDVVLLRLIDAFLLAGVERVAEKVAEIVAVRNKSKGFASSVGDLVAVAEEMIDKLKQRAEIILTPLS
ncbi:MAG: hypothetical protein HYY30_00245 [Chloroflexi bacterium]|nr:hypothetical protein [Chloroflexota bacterium]